MLFESMFLSHVTSIDEVSLDLHTVLEGNGHHYTHHKNLISGVFLLFTNEV
jgi:hypothetical protein